MAQITGQEKMSLKINIKNPKKFTAHRSGWAFAINSLKKFHDNKGILFDDFLDITFGYSANKNLDNGTIPYKEPWIGVLHHPPNICPWYDENYKNAIDIHHFLNRPEFLISLERCECIIVLSDYLATYLKQNFDQFKHIPIVTIKHPTESPYLRWDFNKFKKSSAAYGTKILSIGYFLRNMTSIYQIKSNRRLDKYLLPSDIRYGLHNLSRELKYKNLSHLDKNSIKILNWQEHSFYDKLLEQSLVFVDLYDASCNNAIIESIIRSTPIIVNRHPAVMEYLGEDYPLYYDNIEEISDLILHDTIYDAHNYINNNHHQYKYLDSNYFANDFESKILDSINIKTKKTKYTISASNISELNIVSTKNNFKHRYGWNWITENINATFSNTKNTASNKSTLYINDFVEHTFKYQKVNTNKIAIINKKQKPLIRGFNLFSAKNTDIALVDDKYYAWKNNEWVIDDDPDIGTKCDIFSIFNYKKYPWIGFLHNPINMPLWFDYSQNINSIINSVDFVECLENCKKLFVFSNSLKTNLIELFKKHSIKYPQIKNIKHPVYNNGKKFNFDKFKKSQTVLQIGYWLRNMQSLWKLKTKKNKIWLYGDKFAADMFAAESSIYGSVLDKKNIEKVCSAISIQNNDLIDNVNVAYLPDAKYDLIFERSIVFLDLYDASANNAVLECASSATPIIVNRLPAIEEYLGKEYPLFFNDIDHAQELISNDSAILEGHRYLIDTFKHDEHSMQKFLDTLTLEINKICKK